jgi:hypothetical protein
MLRGLLVGGGCGLIPGDDGVHQLEKLLLALSQEVEEQSGRLQSPVGCW